MEQMQSIPAKHRESVAQLVSIFGLTVEQAYNHLRIMGFDIDRAIQNQLNPHIYEANLPISSLLEEDFLKQKHRRKRDIINVDEDDDSQITKKYSPFQRSIGFSEQKKRRQFMKTYMIKKKEKPRKKINEYRRGRSKVNSDNNQINVDKMQEQFVFSKAFSSFLEEEPYITFVSEPYDVFYSMWHERKMVAVHCLSFSKKIQQNNPDLQLEQDNIKQLYQSPTFVQIFNINFINLGIDPLKFDFEHFAFMKELIKPKQDNFCIVLLSYDRWTNRVVVFQKLKIKESFKITEPQKMKEMANNIVRRHLRITSSAENGIKPLSELERRKIQDDRLIRQQQQQQYFQHLNAKQQQQNILNIQKNQQKQQEEIKVSMQEKRVYLRQNMIKYKAEEITDPIQLKLRLPNSQYIRLTLPKSQTISYIFDFIESNQLSEMGFQNENQRNFDIVHPLDRIYLSTRRNQTLAEVFQNSSMQTLAIKQI